MGSGGSKLDGNGGSIALPAKLRPLFLHRLEEIKMRRHAQPLKNSTPSKKVLLLHDRDHDLENIANSHSNEHHFSSHHDTEGDHSSKESCDINATKEDNICVIKQREVLKECRQGLKVKNHDQKEMNASSKDGKVIKIDRDVLTDGDRSEGEDDDDEEYDNERMIGSHEDDEAFPGSPSFRIYFSDNYNAEDDHNDNAKNDDFCRDREAVLSDDGGSSLKGSAGNKKVKKGRKMRSFRKVLPKGGQVAVKNLFNVKSCYNPSQSSHDRTHLLTGKTTA